MPHETSEDSNDDTLSGPADDRTMVARRGRADPALALPIGHFLVWQEPDGPLRRLRIPPDGLDLGRTPPAGLVLANPEVSRRHCRVELEAGAVAVTDLASTNGTYVAGKRIARRTRLGNGAQLRVGPFALRYEQRDLDELAEAESLAGELRQASEYVRAILPEPIPTGPVQAEWWYVPSSHLGGDAFGYQALDDGSFTGFLLDVSGHGIGPAMHAVAVANVLRRRGLPGVDFADPSQVAAGLNAMFPMEQHNGLLLTFWYFVYTPSRRELAYASAGHHAGLLRAPGQPASHRLAARGPMIGMLPRGTWPTERVAVPPASRLCVFSDGAFEITATNGTAWTVDDLAAIIDQPDHDAPPTVQRIYQAIRAAAPPGPLEDDCTLMVITFE